MGDEQPSEASVPATPVERLFPFVLKTRSLIIGRDALRANKARLHFILITEDISETSREEVLRNFAHYPVVQHFTSADLEKFFGAMVKGAKAVGFAKSGLAQSIYADLKPFRLNKPANAPRPQAAESSRPTGQPFKKFVNIGSGGDAKSKSRPRH